MKLAVSQFHSLREALTERASTFEDCEMLLHLNLNGLVENQLTFRSLHDESHKLALKLLSSNLKLGDRVLLIFNNDLNFIRAFWASLYAGLIAVPLYPPKGDKPSDRLDAVILDCKPAALLTTSKIRASIFASQGSLATHSEVFNVPIICIDDETTQPASQSERLQLPPLGMSSMALLQYTSGSTGHPKGVILTHGNLIANAEMLIEGYNYASGDRAFCWMPFYHDLGLMGGVIIPILAGVKTWIGDPRFLVRPLKWWTIISRYQITTTAAPNFALERLCQLETDTLNNHLSLESLKLLICGAEPIRLETFEKVVAKFEPMGFNKNCLTPSYGLAEATVLATTVKTKPYKAIKFKWEDCERNFVSCGTPVLDLQLWLQDADTGQRIQSPYVVGEVCLKGRNVSSGYWNSEVNQCPELPTLLKTGDLGFLDEEGNLFLVGRLKDLIIIRGRKYHAVDIEETVYHFLPEISGLTVCAFQLNSCEFQNKGDQDSQVIVVLGTKDQEQQKFLQSITQNLHAHLCMELGLNEVTFNIGSIQMIKRTSSGKLRRQETRKLFLNTLIESNKFESQLKGFIDASLDQLG